VVPVLFHIGSIVIPSYGALAALGVLLGLFLAQRTSRIAQVNAAQLWNLCVIAVFAALVGARLLLVLVNWSDLRLHPAWMLGLAMVHHPLVAAAGALSGAIAALLYARWRRLPLPATADALAAPLALGLAFEQAGELLAGSGFGTQANVPWAITYTNPLAELYAALAYLVIAAALFAWMPRRRQPGDAAGLGLLAIGVALFVTEIWRDPVGRGSLLGSALDGPQAAAVAVVVAGGLVLRERKQAGADRSLAGHPHHQAGTDVQGDSDATRVSGEAAHE
jgi:phosphatidylglycerol:prolipoprotein diacylglycerol transferase